MSVKLNRKQESVRDRIKRYLNKLSKSDKNEILREAKSSPNSYVYFKKKSDGSRRIDKISDDAPTLNNRGFKQKKKKKRSTKKGSGSSKRVLNFDWLKNKIFNKDPYFALEHQVQFLSDLFNHLINNHGVREKQVENFIQQSNSEVSLTDILQFFNVRF